jgi:hypothetical protein
MNVTRVEMELGSLVTNVAGIEGRIETDVGALVTNVTDLTTRLECVTPESNAEKTPFAVVTSTWKMVILKQELRSPITAKVI